MEIKKYTGEEIYEVMLKMKETFGNVVNSIDSIASLTEELRFSIGLVGDVIKEDNIVNYHKCALLIMIASDPSIMSVESFAERIARCEEHPAFDTIVDLQVLADRFETHEECVKSTCEVVKERAKIFDELCIEYNISDTYDITGRAMILYDRLSHAIPEAYKQEIRNEMDNHVEEMKKKHSPKKRLFGRK